MKTTSYPDADAPPVEHVKDNREVHAVLAKRARQ